MILLMEFKKKIATTSATRHQLKITKNVLTKKNNVVKHLIRGIKLNYGRSRSTGDVTVSHKGNGCKKSLHTTSSPFKTYFGACISHMYNCKRNTFISLNFDFNNKMFFKTPSTANVFPGSIVLANSNMNEFSIGCKLQLKHFPIGSIINSISSSNKIVYGSAAGSFCQLLERKSFCKIRLPSGTFISLDRNFFATFGVVNNNKDKLTFIGKAGRNRLLGKRPSVRGVAMNPVDHPHGGKTNGGRPCVTPWGIPTRGKPTVKKKL
jgi:large subunit ribosomal protein L2